MQGRRPGHWYYKNTYVYNTESRTYQDVGLVESGHWSGLRGVGCAMKPGEAVLMCAGGSSDWINTNR